MHISEEGCALEWLALEGSYSNPMFIACLMVLMSTWTARRYLECHVFFDAQRVFACRSRETPQHHAPGHSSAFCNHLSSAVSHLASVLPRCERQVSLGFFCSIFCTFRVPNCDPLVVKWPQRDGAVWRCHFVDSSSCLLLFSVASVCPTNHIGDGADPKLTRSKQRQIYFKKKKSRRPCTSQVLNLRRVGRGACCGTRCAGHYMACLPLRVRSVAAWSRLASHAPHLEHNGDGRMTVSSANYFVYFFFSFGHVYDELSLHTCCNKELECSQDFLSQQDVCG